jgi:DNA replication factor GINS
MDLSELHRVQRQERSTDSLQELRESFYADVAAYLEDLRETRAAAAEEADDPFRSARVSELTSEIETAEHVAEAIYQRRIGKLVDEASLVATGNGETTGGLTAEEQELFEALVERIRQNRDSVLGQFRGEVSVPERPGSDDDTETQPTERTDTPARYSHPPDEPLDEGGPDPAAAMSGDLDGPAPEKTATDGESGDDAAEDATAVERTTIRMTADVGEIFGVDAESYELNRDDVVDLPRENADPLVDRDVAERVE